MTAAGLFAFVVLAAGIGAARPAFARTRWWRRCFVAAAAIVIVGVSWSVAFPQEHTDFDTWAELARFRHGLTQDLVKRHRPLHYYLEYWLVQPMKLVQPDLRKCRAAVSVAALLAAFVVMVRCRRTLFGGGGVELPVVCVLAFLSTAGGEFLVDSWNDHLPLAPFVLLGIVALSLFPRNPRRGALAVFVLFLCHSMLHSAEPWLWACGIVAVVACGRRGRGGRARWGWAFAALAGMVCVSLAILSLFPGGAGAAGTYLSEYARTLLDRESLRLYAYGFARGGVVEIRARLLIPAIVLLLAWLFVLAARRRRCPDAVLLVVCAAAAVFPVLYEPTNPERYWMFALLWCVVCARSLRVWAAMHRLGRSSALRAGHLALCVCLLAACGAGAVRMQGDIGKNAFYNMCGEGLAANLDARGVAVVRQRSDCPFYLWIMYWHPGPVRLLRPGDDAPDAVAALPASSPVYVDRATAREMADAGTTSVVVYGCGIDPDTGIHELRGGGK